MHPLWKPTLEKGMSIFEKYMDYIKSKAIFNWQPITNSILRNVTLIHCSQLFEYSQNQSQLEYAYYILTSKCLIKLKVHPYIE